jgi:hypothetical protein
MGANSFDAHGQKSNFDNNDALLIARKSIFLATKMIEIAHSYTKNAKNKDELKLSKKLLISTANEFCGNQKSLHAKSCFIPLMLIKWLTQQPDFCEIPYDSREISQLSGYKQGGTGMSAFVGDAFEDDKGRLWALVAFCSWDNYEYENEGYQPYTVQDWKADERTPEKKYKGDYDISSMCTSCELFFRKIDKTGIYYDFWDYERAKEHSIWAQLPKNSRKEMDDAVNFLQMIQAGAELTAYAQTMQEP